MGSDLGYTKFIRDTKYAIRHTRYDIGENSKRSSLPQEKEDRSFWAKTWNFFRWPILAGFLLIALVIFFVGLVFNFGYSGTTPIRQMNLNDKTDKAYWGKLLTLFESTNKGKPYDSVSKAEIERKRDPKNNIVNYDRRLARELIYLAAGGAQNNKCGWNGLSDSRHDRIDLQIEGGPLSNPKTNLPSSSTLGRGVGVRINGADYIKCSYKKREDIQDGCDGLWYKYRKYPILFPEIDGSTHYGEDVLKITVDTKCIEKIHCAIDYYPHLPSRERAPGEELSEDKPSDKDNPVIKLLNPDILKNDDPILNSEKLAAFARKAAVYKIAQIGLQLLATDDQGCENKTASIWPSEACKPNAANKLSGNIGNCRNIPYTIIFPLWVYEKIKTNVWSDFMKIARGEYPNSQSSLYKGFPYNLQDESPTAGISVDEKLNSQGLHFNY